MGETPDDDPKREEFQAIRARMDARLGPPPTIVCIDCHYEVQWLGAMTAEMASGCWRCPPCRAAFDARGTGRSPQDCATTTYRSSASCPRYPIPASRLRIPPRPSP
jgi:hypothetical protein